ncbi:MAG: hypothetical protein K9M36_02330 [Candidatus Pacebacteria bacterium]|nr:hypothetical protein [Candidatus Paceibacterota bacterium]
MPKKLFSIFITSLVAISGVAMVPVSVDALTMVPVIRSCQIGGVIEKAFYFENINPDGRSSGYYLDIYLIQSDPLPLSAEPSHCPFMGRRQQYFFPLDMLPAAITASLLENRFIDFTIDDESNEINPLITEKKVINNCSIEGEITEAVRLDQLITPPVMCGKEYNYPCYIRELFFPIKITSVASTIPGQCNSEFSIGQEKDFLILSSNIQGDRSDPTLGKKVTINGELTEKGFYPRSASISETSKPKPEDPKDEPEVKEDNNEKQQDELTPVLDTPIESTKTTTDSNFLVGILVGLLVGLTAVVITFLAKRKR